MILYPSHPDTNLEKVSINSRLASTVSGSIINAGSLTPIIQTVFTERLSVCDAIIPNNLENDDYKPSYHLYLLQIDPKKAGGDVQVLKKKLEEKSVTNIPHFGPLYYFDILKTFGYDVNEIKASCPVCEEAFFHRFTHLPLYGLSDEQIEYMINAVLESIEEMKQGK